MKGCELVDDHQSAGNHYCFIFRDGVSAGVHLPGRLLSLSSLAWQIAISLLTFLTDCSLIPHLPDRLLSLSSLTCQIVFSLLTYLSDFYPSLLFSVTLLSLLSLPRLILISLLTIPSFYSFFPL